MQRNPILLLIVLALAGGAAWYLFYGTSPAPAVDTTGTPKLVTFICDEGKTIDATFYIGDDKFVDLKLSDGRTLSVPRALSASGARYATADESFVFWNKGDTAFITEGAQATTTYANCAL